MTFGLDNEIAVRRNYANAVFLHGGKVWAAGVQRHIVCRRATCRAPMYPPIAPAPTMRYLIYLVPDNASATARRWILPVAVRGIVSTM